MKIAANLDIERPIMLELEADYREYHRRKRHQKPTLDGTLVYDRRILSALRAGGF